MLRKIKSQFFSGLVIFVPVSLTVYFIWLFFIFMSQALAPVLESQKLIHLPSAGIRPLAFFLTIFFIWFLGLIASNYIGRRMVEWLEAGIHHIPFFRGMYEAMQKMAQAFFGSKSPYQSVVLVEYPRKGTHTFGFVTNRVSGKAFGSSETYLCLFVPTVPNPTSGLLIYVAESETILLHMTIEEAAKILVSHGFVSIPDNAAERTR